MTLKSRLEKLERLVGPRPIETIRRPAEVPEEIWPRVLELLNDLPPDELDGWKGIGELAKSYRERQVDTIECCPEPVLDCVRRAIVEAETGTLPPPRNERARLVRANLGNWSEDKLIAFLRRLDEGLSDHCLPWPYSTSLLDGMSERVSAHATYLACELRRGAITPEKHAAELAKFLPPVTRADLEKAVRNLPDELLGWYLDRDLATPGPELAANSPQNSLTVVDTVAGVGQET